MDTLAEAVRAILKTQWLGQEFIYEEVTDSTNIQAKKAAEAGASHGTVATAGTQTAGKGRRGRGWVSPEGVNIYLSAVFRPTFPAERAPMLTLVTAYAAAHAIREVTGLLAEIKWPNDLVINGKKICGILTEMGAANGQVQYIVTGIGINTNMTELSEEIAPMATSLMLESGRRVDRAVLTASLLRHLEAAYERYEKEQSLKWMQQEYNAMLVNYNEQVRILDPAGEYCGISYGIDEEGQLIVRKESGDLVKIFSGEVSVRGVYGYAG